jgi:hypothetical protein
MKLTRIISAGKSNKKRIYAVDLQKSFSQKESGV